MSQNKTGGSPPYLIKDNEVEACQNLNITAQQGNATAIHDTLKRHVKPEKNVVYQHYIKSNQIYLYIPFYTQACHRGLHMRP